MNYAFVIIWIRCYLNRLSNEFGVIIKITFSYEEKFDANFLIAPPKLNKTWQNERVDFIRSRT